MNTPALATGLLLTTLAPPVLAQQPPVGPPPAGEERGPGARDIELLPEIGRIGAEVGALAGAAFLPEGFGHGWQAGGFVDLPLARTAAGRLSYEIVMALSGGSRSATSLRVLQVSPFSLKYAFTGLDDAGLRPYVTAGVDAAVQVKDEGGSTPARIDLGGHGTAGLEVRVARGVSLDAEYRFTALGGGRRLQVVAAGFGIHW